MEEFFNSLKSSFGNFVGNALPKLLGCILIIIIGLWLVKLILSFVEKGLKKTKIDVTLHSFIKSLIKILLMMVVFITAGEKIGISPSSFITILGAAGVAVSLALKDSLSNFASGMLILATKPFKVGDVVEINDVVGKIESIELMFTCILTLDNKKVMIPNSIVTSQKQTNYSAEEFRRVDLVYSISYSDDILKAKDVIKDVADKCDKIVDSTKTIIAVGEHAASSINLDVKVWCKNEDYWSVFYFMQENIKLAFDENGITIPFNQLDLNINGDNGTNIGKD